MKNLNRKDKDRMIVNIQSFLNTAVDPERLQILEQLGITQTLLDRGNSLIQQWVIRQSELETAQSKLEITTKTKKTVRKVAELEMRH